MSSNASQASILVVEDERLIARSVEMQLRSVGYAVAGSARTGEEAVRLADTLRPDLILMDINLGDGIDGVQAADLIRQRHNIPVVFLTAHSDGATLQRAKLTEPYGYVLKPFEEADLKIAIEIGLYKGRADRRVRENEQWLAATLAGIGDGVIATDEQGRVRFLNDLAEGLTGWSQADAAGRDVREIFHTLHERTKEPVQNSALTAITRGEVIALPADTVLVSRDGSERPINDSAAPIRDASGAVAGAVLVFRDVTERKWLEVHLRNAAKMEAVGRLAGGIAHDFNNIMTVVTGYSQLLRSNDLPPTVRDRYLGLIHDAGQRAAGLTRQILAFGRKQVLAPTVLDLNTCVRDLVAVVDRLIGGQIDLATHTDPDLGRVKADATQVEQVLLNLALNARDAMPRGGRLTITTSNAELDERATSGHPDVAPGRYVALVVSDTGVGIPADVLPNIFEPFYTTKGVGQGTGLGLATVYGIVKQSGGHIAAESTVGRGTTLRVYLPRIDEPAPVRAGATDVSTARGTETVLVVEDEETVRTMLALILKRQGYTVLEAADGKDGLEVAQMHTGPIHLLLTDLVMPRMGGRELSEAVTALRSDTKVLFMSGHTEDELIHQGVASSSANFIHKPFTLNAVASKMRDVLDQA